MTWFAIQSAIMLLLAFVLGALVGYWYWRIQYRKVAFTESEAVTVINRRHEKALAEKDSEIHRLQGLVAAGAVTDSDPAPDTAADTAPVVAAVDTGADSVDTPDTDTPDTDTPDTDTPDADTPDTDTPDTEAAAPDADTANTSDASDTPEASDVTDTADAETHAASAEQVPDAAALAVAQLPTQSAGGSTVVDDNAAGADTGDDEQPAGDRASGTVEDGAGDGTVDTPVDDAGTPAAAVATPVAAGLVGAAEDQPEDGTEDDLERIEGIGPRIASALRSAGIRSFQRLADCDVPTLQAALEAAGLRFAPSLPTWSRQARFLADGDEVGFIKLTESLVAGREPGRSR